MTDPDTNLLCEQAGLYYYDFLHKESCEPVPESIINHIECCEYCQQQVNLLKETLSQAESSESEQAQTRAVINEILGLHFAYIGRPVTCNIVKPFLPCLLDPALEIRIPTPITAHLDNCRQCREDLETLRALNLSCKQLRRLGQLFAEKPNEDIISCSEAQALAEMDKVQDLYRVIIERPESETATICTIDKSAKAKAVGKSGDLYTGFPIRVEIAHRSEDEVDAGRPVSIINFGAILKQKVSTMNLGRLAKTATVAATVILIATALLLNIPTAKAVTIGQIYKAVEKVGNVYISKFVPDKTEPIQEKWVSRTLNIYMTKTGKQLVLWDLNEARKTKQLDTVVTETISLTAVSVADIEKKMTGSLGLTPFYDISDVPQDAQWNRITGEGLKIADKGVEIYDLTWVEKKYGGAIVFNKWRVFVDAATNLPQKVEWYKKLPADSEYTLEMEMAVKYLSDSEMQAVIEDSSF